MYVSGWMRALLEQTFTSRNIIFFFFFCRNEERKICLKDCWIQRGICVSIVFRKDINVYRSFLKFFLGKSQESRMNTINHDYKNLVILESPAMSIATFVMMMLSTIVILILALVATPAHAGQYDGTSWSAASRGVQVIPYDPARCELCRAENGRPAMTECGPPASMQAGVPYVIYCGGSTWGDAGSAPGTTMVGPGGSVGSFTAQSDDYWTVKQ